MSLLAIMSDIHGNLNACMSSIESLKKKDIDALLLLGDLIDYGMRSNEVIELLKELPYPVLCNIRGNHEQAMITGDYAQFSSERGRQCAQYTKSILSQNTWRYITEDMSDSGMYEFEQQGKRCLAVHGSLTDIYWKSIKPGGHDLSAYQKYDYVFSGHSHLPHYFEVFYEVDNPIYRNRKKTIFINPGSVGQPRNHNPLAQYAILDTETETVTYEKISYNVAEEQKAYFGQVDDFYRMRLEIGV